jgi:hypothetical protein
MADIQTATEGYQSPLQVLKPFTNVQALVFARRSSGPFSCRMRVVHGWRKKEVVRATVYGVLMPLRSDNESEPVLQWMPADKYSDLQDCRAVIEEIVLHLKRMDIAELKDFAERNIIPLRGI